MKSYFWAINGTVYRIHIYLFNLATMKSKLLFLILMAVPQLCAGALPSQAIFEENAKTYNEIYLGTVAAGQDSLSADQKATLTSMAETCPLIGGPAVFKARSLRNLYDPKFQYDNAMACANWGVQWLTQGPSANDSETSGFAMFPNPVNDMLNLKWVGDEKGQGILEVSDALGRIIDTRSIVLDAQELVLGTQKLTNGIYSISVRDANGAVLFLEKLVVTKD